MRPDQRAARDDDLPSLIRAREAEAPHCDRLHSAAPVNIPLQRRDAARELEVCVWHGRCRDAVFPNVIAIE
jgi:hypothetical protein